MAEDKFKEIKRKQETAGESVVVKEKIEQPDLGAERKMEQGPETMAETAVEAEGRAKKEIAPPASLPAAGAVSREKQEREKRIEKILEKDLADVYAGLPPNKQREFKIAGERTAREINNLLDKARVKAMQIITLIKKWLSLLPGINKFFLEQEAKIKTDEIMRLKEEK